MASAGVIIMSIVAVIAILVSIIVLVLSITDKKKSQNVNRNLIFERPPLGDVS